MNPRRALSLLLGAVVLALVLSPPHHHGASSTHPTHACRLCKLQDGVSATPPVSSAVAVVVSGAWHLAWQPIDVPRVSADLSSSSPRSPPRLA